MNLKEKIEIMQAYDSGSDIEVRIDDLVNWCSVPEPVWNWDSYEYRIKPDKKLKPCPFCRSKLHIHDLNESHDLRCKNTECLLYFGLESGVKLEQIMRQWSE